MMLADFLISLGLILIFSGLILFVVVPLHWYFLVPLLLLLFSWTYSYFFPSPFGSFN
jgi:hypothetical protein